MRKETRDKSVIPANAGIQGGVLWTPAFAGVTGFMFKGGECRHEG